MITKRQEQIIVNQWAALLRLLKRDIQDCYRADEDNPLPSMRVTFGLNAKGEWGYQTGDTSCTGGAYGFIAWGTVYLYRRTNCKIAAQGAFSEAEEQLVYEDSQ